MIRGKKGEEEWERKFVRYEKDFPKEAADLRRYRNSEFAGGWEKDIPAFPADAKGMATRVASGQVMNAIAPHMSELIGGSADLNPSTFTALKGMGDFEPPADEITDDQGSAGGGWSYAGRNLHFGVREHAMGGILNGIAAHGGLIPYGATFLIFSDYMRPPLRLAALSGLQVIYVFTHDSIGLGQEARRTSLWSRSPFAGYPELHDNPAGRSLRNCAGRIAALRNRKALRPPCARDRMSLPLTDRKMILQTI